MEPIDENMSEQQAMTGAIPSSSLNIPPTQWSLEAKSSFTNNNANIDAASQPLLMATPSKVTDSNQVAAHINALFDQLVRNRAPIFHPVH